MLHNNLVQTNFIRKHESIYRDSPVGKLDKIRMVRFMTSPLQQGFESNIFARMSIGIDFNSAGLASEQSIIGTVMSLPNSTAVGTELGCMPCINDVKCNTFVKTPLSKVLFESKERDSHDLSVEPLSLRTELLEVFNGNVSIIS